jgi:hypothetical protein
MSTLSDLRGYCQYHGWDRNDTSGLKQLDNFINDTFQLLSDLAPWPEFQHVNGSATFLQSAKTISTIGDSAGTVTVVTTTAHGYASNDIVTVSDTTNFDESDVRITVSDTTTFTYTSTSTGDDEEAGTVTRCGDRKVLTQTRLKRIGSLFRTDRAAPLTEYSQEDWLLDKKYHAGTGYPTHYALSEFLSTNTEYKEIFVYPEATTSTTIYFTWESYPLVLTSISDVYEWPDRRKWILFEALRTRLAQADRDVRGTILYGEEFMMKVGRAMNGSRLSSRPILANPKVYRRTVSLRSCEKTITS